jgi:hypothetical protein
MENLNHDHAQPYYLIRLTKLRAAPDARVPAGSWNTYAPGSWLNTESLPVDYVLIGLLLAPIEPGQPVRIFRLVRNGLHQLGLFRSTPVAEVLPEGFRTANSVYRIEPYEGADLADLLAQCLSLLPDQPGDTLHLQ